MATNITRGFASLLWKIWYPILTRISSKASLSFLNYGYAEEKSDGRDPKLEEKDEGDRPCIQLYHRVVSAVDVRGMDVLEVSCGHGGGAAYVASYMKPKSMRGVDRNGKAIEFCQRQHHVDGLTFSQGNAMGLEFGDGSFDAVVNVEASHCYPDVGRFFSEVRRVLRPGGHFLYADFRERDTAMKIWEEQLRCSGMEIIASTDITANVVQGMDLNEKKYQELIGRLIPKVLRKAAGEFAGMKGSGIYNALKTGKSRYMCYHLRKPMSAPS